MIPAIEVRRDNCRAAAARGFSTATDLADYLVNKGLPFRDAHHVVGSTVAFAQQKGCDIAELSLAELRTFSELIGEDVYAKITLEGSLAARNHYGATSPAQVRAAIARARATRPARSEEHTSELQSLMRITYDDFCLEKK